jgi:3-isopropylmalate/(R)-2-methylmalate dehydratase small subunit
MDKFTTLTGVAAPMPIVNVDTDMIIPKQFLKTIKRTGLGKPVLRNALQRGRHTRTRISCSTSRPTAERADPGRRRQFRLRLVARARALGAARLRHPLRDLHQLRRHLLQQLLQERHPADPGDEEDARQADGRCPERGANATLTVDLESQEIRGPDGGTIAFEIDPFRKHCLLNGLDDIGLTMEKQDAITAYESKLAESRPWA